MANYLLRRLGFGVLVLLVVTLLAFVLVYLSGDPARTLAGFDASDADVERIRKDYGLDRHLFAQYGTFFADLLRGDLGQSYRTGHAVGPLVLKRFLVTLEL